MAWQTAGVRSYRQYCPIARASEIVAERWTPLVLRNLLYGCRTFTEIARGVPAMSRSLLIKRLRELEGAGVLVKTAGGAYELSDAGADLAGVIEALETWGERWLEVTTEHTDPGFALWAWSKYHLDPEHLPEVRVLVEFRFPEEPPSNRRYWLLAEHRSAEVCYSHPGGEPDVFVTARSEAFTHWHLGRLEWRQALADGSITVSGPTSLARALPTWNRHPEPLAATRAQ
ncbi:MAG: helix-turn-helix transcriptional regulator [Actinomycetota bacterium]|nr:helix-turn-helix transcriptional regulator [Actinomycetota bacterium]